MKKLVAIVLLSAVAVLVPAGAQAFTLYTPAFTNDEMTCTLVNVGSITLQVDLAAFKDIGTRWPTEVSYQDVLPGKSIAHGTSEAGYNRCVFKVRAKNPSKTATASMVRAAVLFVDFSGEAYSFEAR